MRLVLPRCRQQINRDDVAFLAETLAPSVESRAAVTALLDDAPMRDRLLDEDTVRERLLESPTQLHVSPALYFFVLVRHVLRQAGVDDRMLADYLASLLLSYMEAVADDAQSGHVPYVVDKMADISAAAGADRFFLVVELADQLLFMTGIYPQHIEHRRERRGAPPLNYYENVGGSHYRVASDHALAREFCLEGIFRSLGEAFHEVRIALNNIGEKLAFTGDDDPNSGRYLLN